MRPQYHFTTNKGWLNDPNGLIYYQGNYHLFYQHFPYAPSWGTIHWGHAVSKDLVHFKHLPIALYPSKIYDQNGCFSGSSVIFKNQLYFYYTAIRYQELDEENIHKQKYPDVLIASQARIKSQDGFTFDNFHDKQQVLLPITDPKIGDFHHTRDPKVWVGKNGHLYMIIGSKVKRNQTYKGQVLFYESEDGQHFHYKNKFIDDDFGDMLECPDLFEIEGQTFLSYCPEHVMTSPGPDSLARIMPVSFNEQSCTLTKLGPSQCLDHGRDYYAMQSFLDENKQRASLAWIRMRIPEKGDSFVGMFSYPRIFKLKGLQVYQKVHPNIESLFKQEVNQINWSIPFKMNYVLEENEEIQLAGLKLKIQQDSLFVDRTLVTIEHPKVAKTCVSEKLNHYYDLEIYYDHQIFEIFIHGGMQVVSQNVYSIQPQLTFYQKQKACIKQAMAD